MLLGGALLIICKCILAMLQNKIKITSNNNNKATVTATYSTKEANEQCEAEEKSRPKWSRLAYTIVKFRTCEKWDSAAKVNKAMEKNSTDQTTELRKQEATVRVILCQLSRVSYSMPFDHGTIVAVAVVVVVLCYSTYGIIDYPS